MKTIETPEFDIVVLEEEDQWEFVSHLALTHTYRSLNKLITNQGTLYQHIVTRRTDGGYGIGNSKTKYSWNDVDGKLFTDLNSVTEQQAYEYCPNIYGNENYKAVDGLKALISSILKRHGMELRVGERPSCGFCDPGSFDYDFLEEQQAQYDKAIPPSRVIIKKK